MMLWKGRMALASRLLAPNISSHDGATKLLLGRRCGAKDRFALGLMYWR